MQHAGENNYGTTSAMVIDSIEINGEERILALDEKGVYLTAPRLVDAGLADINRFGVPRDHFHRLLSAQGLDPVSIEAENRHLLDVHSDAGPAKKINPLKASKRL